MAQCSYNVNTMAHESVIVKEGVDQKTWNEFLVSQGESEFLQSFEWGDFYASQGISVVRLRMESAGGLVSQVEGFKYAVPLLGHFLYIPRCVIQDDHTDAFIQYLHKKEYIFARMEPVHPMIIEDHMTKETRNRQPQDTAILNLNIGKDAFLQNMHAKTRYNIGLAERKGVRIVEKKDPELFWRLNVETAKRDAFKSHTKQYYSGMIGMDIAHQFNAMVGDTCIASNICVGFGDTFTYVHGASSNEHRNLMAPYLLQWHQMSYAMQHNFFRYDFWGIASEGHGVSQTMFHNLTWDATHVLTGVTRFKAGFGSYRRVYPRAFEVLIRPRSYKILTLAKRLKTMLSV